MGLLMVNITAGTIIGASLASWLGLVADRLPRRMSLNSPPSTCACGARLGAVALVPVIGWLVQRGRARCCGEAIPRRYPLMEIAGGAAGAAIAACAGVTSLLVIALVLMIAPLGASVLMAKKG